MYNSNSSRFEAVIFDMGDILYDASVWRRWLTSELQRHGVDITYLELVERWERLLVDVYRGEADYWARFSELLDEVGLDAGSIDQVTDAAREKAIEVQVGRKPVVRAPETLARLKAAGIRLAVLSDTESGSEKVRKLLRELGLEIYFDAVVTSADIGFVKPEPEAFESAATALATDVDRCVFVGHDVDELEGSLRTGMFTAAYNYHPAAPADVYLDQFDELCDVVFGTGVESI